MADQILIENQKPGTPKSVWDVPSSNQIEGFATDFSVDNGSTVSFKINLNVAEGATAPYRIEIYRLGYYGGDGATLVTTLNDLTGTAQPDPITDSRGLVDAGNWSVSASWATPADAVSGVYLAKLVRTDNGATNQIPFIVRDDGGTSDVLLQTSDTTWQAYNGWAGRNGQVGPSLYGGFDQPTDIAPDQNPLDQDRAFAVSYNRPFITRDGVDAYAGGQDYLFGADYAAIYWLEKNGYDVSYVSGVDTDRLGANYLTSHKAFISVGHDEYWSGAQRANVEAARDAGVNLLFWSGNEAYWKTRWESSIVDGVEYRTLVCYKETKFNYSLNATAQDYANVDPSNEWTGTWRDLRFVNAVGPDGVTHTAVGAKPENALTGQLFGPDGTGEFGGALDIPAAYAGLRVWRDTGVGPNGAQNIAPGILGYEWDTSPVDAFRPASLIKLSETTIPWSEILTDQGNRTAPGEATHSLSLYRDDSGALVFGAGTVFWSWGLSNEHDSSPYGANVESTLLQQFTVNMFADMGIQPGVSDAILQSQGLVRALASNDHIAATATLNNLPDSVSDFSQVTISGTAADVDNNPSNDDGRVALVEVSVDGGVNWRVAQGTANWTYSWTPTAQGTYTIKARAVDDSLNLLPNGQLATDVVTVTAPQPDTFSLFGSITPTGQASNDGQAVELGVKFSATQAGAVTQLRYFRAAGDSNDTDLRQGHLWSSNGTLLATVSFNSAPGQSGWQTATLSTPVAIQAGTTYVVSYKTADNYFATGNYFTSTFTEPFGVLSAPASGAVGGNGVYAYGSALQFPTQTYGAANYWVDLVFDPPGGGTGSPPAFTSSSNFSLSENNTIVGTIQASDPNGDALTYAIAGGADAALFAIHAATGQLRFLSAPDFEAPQDAGADNSYAVTVSVTDGNTPAVQQALAVAVTNLPDTQSGTVSLFGSITPSGQVFNDGAAVELGVKFSATQAGAVTQLRYFRTAADANDTDTREGHLWSSNGTLLGTVSFNSAPGQSGWQTATLSTPVAIQAGTTYVVSYRTADNYLATGNYFTSTVTEPNGVLSAPASGAVGGNGVYAYGSALQFPTQSFGAANYWVDLVFDPPSGGAGSPPAFVLGSSFSVAENNTIVGAIQASDADGDALTYAIVGGDDAALFAIYATIGELRFLSAPDFEAPQDAGADNSYAVTVSVSDGNSPAVQQAITVAVTDVAETPPGSASFAGRSVRAEYIFGSTANTLFPSAGASQIAAVNAAQGAVEFTNLPNADPSAIGNGQFGLAAVDLGDQTLQIQFPLDPSVFNQAYVPFASAQERPFNGVRVTDADGQLPTIRGVSIVSQRGFTDAAGADTPLSVSDLTVTSEGIFLNVAGKGRRVDADAATAGAQPSQIVLSVNLNDTPVAAPDTVSTARDAPIQISTSTLLTGDTDADGDALTLSLVRNPVNGTVALDVATGAVTFTPSAGFVGTASFEYVVTDGFGGAATGAVIVHVGAVITGGSGADTLNGGPGDDSIAGLGGGDQLFGDAGDDTFVYLDFGDSSPSAPDVILDFTGAGGAGGDVIDVSALAPGAFVFNGTGGFSGGGVASIRYASADASTHLEFDNGNGGAAEMIVWIDAVVTFSVQDFIL